MNVTLPKLGEQKSSGVVLEILVSEGDRLEKDQPILEIETDKATASVPAPRAGKVLSVEVARGDEVSSGDTLLVLETDETEGDESPASRGGGEQNDEPPRSDERDGDEEGEDRGDQDGGDEREGSGEAEDRGDEGDEGGGDEGADSRGRAGEERQVEGEEAEGADDARASGEGPAEGAAPSPSEARPRSRRGSGAAMASPAVRQLARELGVEDLSVVAATGRGGSVTLDDLKSHVRHRLSGDGDEEPDQPDGPQLPDLTRWGEVERRPLSGLRRTIARNLTRSWRLIPHVTQGDEADVTALLETLEELGERHHTRLSPTAVLVAVLARAARRFERLRAALDLASDELVVRAYVHVGVAVDTERGLLVAVIRDADDKGVVRIAEELEELAEAARRGRLDAEQMQGATITVTNLGGLGTTTFTPIVPFGQAAILGAGRAAPRVVPGDDGESRARRILPFSLSYDHRIVDGADAARMLRWICRSLEEPLVLIE